MASSPWNCVAVCIQRFGRPKGNQHMLQSLFCFVTASKASVTARRICALFHGDG